MQVVVRVLNLALGVVVAIALVRTLGDAGYGQWATALVALELTGFFMQFGLEAVVVREAAADPEREGQWIGALILVRIIMALPVILAALALIIAVADTTEMLVAGAILAVGMPFGGTGGLQIAFELRVNNRVPMFVLTLKSVLWLIAVLLVAALDGGLVALAIALIVTNGIGALVLAISALRITRIHVRPSRAMLVRLVRVGAPVGIAGLLVLAYARIDQLLVFQIAGAADAGYFGAVYNMLQQAHIVPISVLTTLAPIIAASWPRDRERTLRVVRQGVDLLMIAALGGLAGSIVVAEPLVTLLFGDEFAPAAPALPVLSAAFVFICLGYLTGNLLLVTGLQRRMVVVSGAALVANIVLNLILIPRYGFMGAAWATLATEVVVIGTGAAFLATVMEVRRPSLGRLPRIAAAAAAVGLVLAAAQAAGVSIIPLLALGLVAYPVLLISLGASPLDEVRAVLRRKAAAA